MPCCAAHGSQAIFAALLEARAKRGLVASVYVTMTGCLGPCPAEGCSVVVYPEGVWYAGVTLADVGEIVEQHMVAGRVVERLRDPSWRIEG